MLRGVSTVGVGTVSDDGGETSMAGVVVRPLGSIGEEVRDIGVGHGWIRKDVVLRSQADAGATVLTTNLS